MSDVLTTLKRLTDPIPDSKLLGSRLCVTTSRGHHWTGYWDPLVFHFEYNDDFFDVIGHILDKKNNPVEDVTTRMG